MEQLVFYSLGLGAVIGALGVVTAKNPILSVLSLLWTFFCLACVYLLIGFEFLAVAQILVYAGAIMVLFLFVIMLLNLGTSEAADFDTARAMGRRLPLVLLVGCTLAALAILAAQQVGGTSDEARADLRSVGSLTDLAQVMFGTYLLAFEAASILLLAGTVAVVMLAKRERRKNAA